VGLSTSYTKEKLKPLEIAVAGSSGGPWTHIVKMIGNGVEL
jgi:uroporphyrinogen-III decarboxylase